jgi:hypothetical protein
MLKDEINFSYFSLGWYLKGDLIADSFFTLAPSTITNAPNHYSEQLLFIWLVDTFQDFLIA